jgi:hypothetical protein
MVAGAPSKRNTYGRTWFVNSYAGSNGNVGDSPLSPMATLTEAFTRIASGDVLNIAGKFTEQLVTPANVFDVWVNGMGNRPRHADATPTGGNFMAAQLAPPASGGTAAGATIRVLQQGWRFSNLLFTAIDANAACAEIVRNAGAGNLERDASHAEFLGCRFAGTGIGIRSGVAGLFTEIAFNVLVDGCTFNNMTLAMSGINGNAWQIRNNTFFSNTANITMALQNSFITNNFIGPFTPAANSGGIDLTGGTAGNVITLNYLSGTYSIAGGYKGAGAGDEWGGNMNSIAGGWTAADPA